MPIHPDQRMMGNPDNVSFGTAIPVDTFGAASEFRIFAILVLVQLKEKNK